MLFHERLDDVVAQSVLVCLLATVILLTGLAHILRRVRPRRRTRSPAFPLNILLGMMEIALGLFFLIGSLENSLAAYWAAGIWAFTGGVILIGDALLLRRRLRSQGLIDAPRPLGLGFTRQARTAAVARSLAAIASPRRIVRSKQSEHVGLMDSGLPRVGRITSVPRGRRPPGQPPSLFSNSPWVKSVRSLACRPVAAYVCTTPMPDPATAP